jgi:hypothetical protein
MIIINTTILKKSTKTTRPPSRLVQRSLLNIGAIRMAPGILMMIIMNHHQYQKHKHNTTTVNTALDLTSSPCSAIHKTDNTTTLNLISGPGRPPVLDV